MYVLETNSGLFKELGDVSSLRGLEESTLVGAVLHDFTIGLLLVFDNLYFEENTFLYTLCICILCRTKANN